MLIEFSLSNSRSFSDEQTLSLVASRLRSERRQSTLRIEGPSPLEVLSAAVILGKNGSGKSTLINSLDFVREFVRTSSSEGQEGDKIAFSPHKLDRKLSRSDTSYRVLFSMYNKIYEFEFSFNSDEVTYESLRIADKSPRFRKIYERTLDNDGNHKYSFSEDLRGKKSVWKDSTRRNALFLSTAIQLNAESLREPFEWLTRYLRVIDVTNESYTPFTAEECESPEKKAKILALLRGLDIDVHDIEVEDEEIDGSVYRRMFNEDFIKETLSKAKRKRVRFIHLDTEGNKVSIDLKDESSGTNALFGISGPLFDTLSEGYCLVIDEVNTGLHPLVVRSLIEAFSDPTINRKNAQLIFTTHDSSVLRDKFLRRDQIWFVNKDKERRSALVPLSDFSPRKNEALDKGYLTGRYGGIPSVTPMVALIRNIVGYEENA